MHIIILCLHYRWTLQYRWHWTRKSKYVFSWFFSTFSHKAIFYVVKYLAFVLCFVLPPSLLDVDNQQAEGKELTKEEKQRLRKEKKQQKKNKEKKDDKASQQSEKEKKPVSSAAPASQPPTQVTAQKGAHDMNSTIVCCSWMHGLQSR